jgi:hypothetical protein
MPRGHPSRPNRPPSSGAELGVFSTKALLFAKSWSSLRASFGLQEHPLRTKLEICTEADYLQAHLTIIAAKSPHRNPALDNLKQRVASILTKWIAAANSDLKARSSSLLRPRATSMAQRFVTGSDWREGRQEAHRRLDRNREGPAPPATGANGGTEVAGE